MATYTLTPLPRLGITPDAGMKLYTVTAGGTYPANAATTYQTSAGTAHANPVEASASGLFPAIYLPPGNSYKFICKTSADVTIWTQDGVESVPSSASAIDVTGTAGENLTANAEVYLSDGSGGKSAGQWYLADADNAYSSLEAGYVGMTLAAITSGDLGTIRTAGQLAVTLTLSPGMKYFVSASAGAITTTEPSNGRFVGTADGVNSILLSGNPFTTGASGLNIVQIWGFGG